MMYSFIRYLMVFSAICSANIGPELRYRHYLLTDHADASHALSMSQGDASPPGNSEVGRNLREDEGLMLCRSSRGVRRHLTSQTAIATLTGTALANLACRIDQFDLGMTRTLSAHRPLADVRLLV